MRLLLALLIAAPLAAQDIPIPVPDRILRVEAPPAQVDLTVLVEQLDSTQAAALAAAFAQAAQPGIDLLYQAIAEDREQEQQQGAGTTERVLKTVGWWVLGIIAVKQLYNIANREPDVTNINVTHEDGDIHVTVPPHEHPDHHRKKKDHDDSES